MDVSRKAKTARAQLASDRGEKFDRKTQVTSIEYRHQTYLKGRGTEMPTRVEGTNADPRYPIGHFVPPKTIGPEEIAGAIATIEGLPTALRSATSGLSEDQLDTPYREGGWTVRQLIHHIADSHMNAFLRVRLALTERSPVVTVYDEKAWAELADSKGPIELPLKILDGIHARWITMLRSLDEAQWKREFRHPERGPSTIEMATLLYQWHCLHHTAHVTELRRRKGW